jgi:hypothetical protein
MTNNLENGTKRDNRGRRAGLAVGAGLLVVVGAFGMNVINSGNKTEANAAYTPSPSATELATPRPSEAGASPSASPEASASAEVNIQNFTVEKLGTFDVLPGDIIAGDISMSDTTDSAIFPLYDQDTHKAADVTDNTKTALYVEVQAPGTVHAEWGATVTRGLTAEKKAEMLKLQAISKQRAGFDKVDVVIWTGFDTTTDEAGFKATGEQGSSMPVSPSASPEAGQSLDGLDNQAKIKVILNLFAEGKIDPNSEEGKVLMDVIVSCLCSCSNPTETPKPTPTPTPTSEVCVPMNDHFMKAGETFKVPSSKEFIVQGDVLIDGVRHYDSKDITGAIDKVLDGKSHTVKAPYGADVQVFNACATDQEIKDTYTKDVEQLKASGRTLDSNSLIKN